MAAKVLKGEEACEYLIAAFKADAKRRDQTLEEYLLQWEERDPINMHGFMDFLDSEGYGIFQRDLDADHSGKAK